MPSAIVNVCVDPRIHHDVVRAQARDRLQMLGTPADRIFITSDLGGNVGSSMRNTAAMLTQTSDRLVAVAILFHDTCAAEGLGLRRSLETTKQDVAEFLADLRLTCPVLTGSMLTETNEIRWDGDSPQRFRSFSFRMPRMGT